MKTKGIFRVLAAPILALMGYVKSVPYSTTGGSQAASGRDGFLAVSAGRQHNVRNRHPL
jgi:hypothetical protein